MGTVIAVQAHERTRNTSEWNAPVGAPRPQPSPRPGKTVSLEGPGLREVSQAVDEKPKEAEKGLVRVNRGCPGASKVMLASCQEDRLAGD